MKTTLKNKPIPISTNGHEAGYITAQPEPDWLVRLLVWLLVIIQTRPISRK